MIYLNFKVHFRLLTVDILALKTTPFESVFQTARCIVHSHPSSPMISEWPAMKVRGWSVRGSVPVGLENGYRTACSAHARVSGHGKLGLQLSD